MIPEQRKKSTRYFAVILVVYAAILVFLLFFNPGLELIEEQTIRGTEIFVSNNTAHTIKNIEISTSEGQTIIMIDELKPREKAKIPLTGLKDLVVINAQAPFHASTGKGVSMKGTGGVKISYETSYQNLAVKGTPFSVFLSICNTGSIRLAELTAKESHSPEFFAEQNQEKKISLETGKCEKIEFVLTPEKTGETEIFFNIGSLGVNEAFSRTINTVEV